MKRQREPRVRRLDLINDLAWGQQTEIARIAGCTPAHVSYVLNGHGKQSSELSLKIIRMAEKYAWRERNKFMKELENYNRLKELRRKLKEAF